MRLLQPSKPPTVPAGKGPWTPVEKSPISGVSVNLEEGLRPQPLWSFVAHQKSETQLALEGKDGEELGKALPLFHGAGVSPDGSFLKQVDHPHQF